MSRIRNRYCLFNYHHGAIFVRLSLLTPTIGTVCMYVCMYVFVVISYSRVWINRVRLPILLVVS